MGLDNAIEFTDSLLYEKTGRHLSDLQYCILQQVWGGQTYVAIASAAGYSEGHVKDVASQLWRILSEALGERITKGNYRSRLKYWLKRAKRKVVNGVGKASLTALPGARPGGREALPSLTSKDASVLNPDPALGCDPVDDSVSLAIDPGFVGRANALESLDRLIHQGHKVIVIQGEGGLGKTTLAQHYLQQAGFEILLELRMAKETAHITAVDRIVEEWLLQDFQQEPGQDLGINLDRLKRQLKQHHVGILIDNLEPALDSQGQFLTPHRRYVELLRTVSDLSVNAVTLITSRDRLCEPSIKSQTYRLPSLALTAWQQFFESRGLATHNTPLAQVHQAYGGNAKAMEIVYGATHTEYDGDLAAYWRCHHTDPLAEMDLKNLVVSQVNRLQQLDPMAYELFCRLGCYRYQTIPRLSLQALLAQVEALNVSQPQRVITSLRNRSLLETDKGEYWLHPVVRAVAIERLRDSDQWQGANQTAADYWTQSIAQIITVQEGLSALEAFYHVLAIEDYDAAAHVLLQSRHNQWNQFLPLASSLYRMGLLYPVLDAMTQVLPLLQLEPVERSPDSGVMQDAGDPHVAARTSTLSELYNILGDVYWITGQIAKAIACQERTIANTDQLLLQLEQLDAQKRPDVAHGDSRAKQIYYLKMLNVDSLLSLGLYKIDLWELTEAKAYFEAVIVLAKGTAHDAWADKAAVALALTHSYLGNTEAAQAIAATCLNLFTALQQPAKSGRWAYFIQLLGQTYSNLQDYDTARFLYQQAITFADAGHYVQVKANALKGLAELYRDQNCLEQAVMYHHQSLELLHRLGAKCDLAEAHLQFGLTLRSMAFKAAGDQGQRGLVSITPPVSNMHLDRPEKTPDVPDPLDYRKVYLVEGTDVFDARRSGEQLAAPLLEENDFTQGMGYLQNPERHFQRAIQLFSEIHAPQQVAKVKGLF